MSLAPGTRIGAYDIHGLLGAGGMGEVYRAHDPRLQRDVAVKVLPRDATSNPERLTRFAREAQILATLNHPNIGAIYGLEQAAGFDALVLELVDGPTLAEVIAQGPLPVSDTVRIARQIAGALQAAHDKGIVHRDLKPANVKLTSTGQVKVLDFGLAKVFDEFTRDGADVPTVTGVTRVGVVLGTAAYMAPEQARGQPSGKAADVWAFGCVLYELLTGKPPFSGLTVSDTLAAVLTREVDLQRLPTETPASLRRLLRRCLQRDIDERLRDLGDARLDLNEAVDLSKDPAAAVAPAATRSRRGALLILGALIGIGAAGGYGYWMQPRPLQPALRKFDLVIPGLPSAPVAYPKISPDGQQLAYVAAGKLWVRDLTALGARVILEDSPILFFWSPDGAQIGFVLGERLMRLSAKGGEPILVATLPGHFGSSGWGGTWTRDERIVIAQAGGRAPLLAVPETGGPLTAILEPEAGDFHEPVSLPRGNVILYTVHTRRVDAIAAFDGTRTREVLRVQDENLRFPAYSPTGHLLYERTVASRGIWAIAFNADTLTTSGEPFLVVADGSAPSVALDGTLTYVPAGNTASSLAWIASDGAVSRIGVPQAEAVQQPSLSADGRRTLALRNTPGSPSAIIVFDMKTGTHWRVTSGDAPESWPFWLQDGSVGFSIVRPEAPPRIFSVPADGSRPPALLVENGSGGDASTDGRQVVFTRRTGAEKGEWAIWRRDLTGKHESAVSGSLDRPLMPRLSPDGRLLAYMALTSGSFDLFVRQFSGGDGRWRVSTRTGANPRWNRKGDRLYYVESPGRLMEVEISAGPPVVIGTPRPALSKEPPDAHLMAGFDISADGSRFLAVTRVAAERAPSIVLVQHWAREFTGKPSPR